MAQQHDVDQRRQLPEEVFAAQTEHDGAAVDVRDRDREPDQRHHPRAQRAHLGDETGQEGPAAVEEDGRGKNELDPGIARERERAVEPEPPLDVPGQREHRDRERQRHPEAPAEIGDHVGVVARVSARALARVAGRRVAGRRVATLDCRMVLVCRGLRGRSSRTQVRSRFFASNSSLLISPRAYR